MEIIKWKLPTNHEIGWAACFHFGNANQHLEGIKKYIAWLRGSKNRYGFINGDIAEAIHKNDKRYEAGQHTQLILDQYATAAKMFKPVRHKLLGANEGNHDHTIASYGCFVEKLFCEPLEIPYGTYSSKLIINDLKGRLQYKVFTTHGNGSVGSKHHDPVLRTAQEQSKVKAKLSAERMGDCLLNVIAHFHRGIIVEPVQELYLTDDGESIRQKYADEADPRAKFIPVDLRYYLSCPGFIKKYALGSSSYGERAGYAPLELGFIITKAVAGKIISCKKILV